MIVRKQVKSSRKYGLAQKLVLKTKGPYRVLEKATSSSYWLQRLPCRECIGSPGRKVKESSARMENIPPNMVFHNHIYRADTIFSTMTGPLVNNPLEKWFGAIIRGTYQAASEDIRWEYEPVSGLCPDIDPNGYSSDDGSSDKLNKDQDNPDD